MNRQTHRPATVRKQYITLRGTGPKSGRAWALKETVAALLQGIASRRRSIVEWERELEQFSAEQARRRRPDAGAMARAGQEFDRLIEHPDIEDLTVWGRQILLTTRPITIQHQRTTYAIGRFLVTIVTDGADQRPRMVNLTRKIEGYGDHPHVPNGKPVWWRLKSNVAALMSEGRYADLALAYLRSLRHYNVTSCSTKITNWPVAGCWPRRPPAKKRHRRGRRIREARARYSILRAGGPESGRSSFLAKKIAETQEALAAERVLLRAEVQELAQYRSKLERLSAADAERARYGLEFDRLIEHPDIERLEIRGRRIFVMTRPILLSHAGRQYKIGRFRIRVPVEGSRDIGMVNLTRTAGGPHHPQGFYSRAVCLGNISSAVQELLQEGNYAVVINLCIQFLRNWGGDPSTRSDGWPIV